jgi:HK97 family phage major capsid protein
MTVDKEELKGMLEGFRDGITKTIEAKSKEQSDAANKEITELKAKLIETETGLAAVQEELKKNKSFGLPGIETEKKNFHWGRYFVGLAKNFKVQKGLGDAGEAKKFWDGEASFEQRVCKDYDATTGANGAFLVPPQIYQGDVIDTVYANTAIMKLPVLKFTGLNTDMPIPVDNGNLSAYSLGETEAPTKTSSSFKLEWLRPKKIGVYVRVSNRLLDQTSNAIEMIVKQKMALDASVELSRCLTNGNGSDSEGKGILKFYADMTDVKNVSANGARFTIDDLAGMKQSLAVANELRDTNTNGAIMHPAAFWGMLRERTEMYSAQANKKGAPTIDGKLLINPADIENALQFKIQSTTQIPGTDTCGTSTANCSKVIVGDWSKFVFATFRDPIFRVSDVASDSTGRSALLNDELFMVMFLEYDCNCLRPKAFSGRAGAIVTEANW